MDAANAAAGLAPRARTSAISQIADGAIMPIAIGLLCYATVAQGGFYRTQGSFVAAGLLALALASASSAAGLGPLLAGAASLALGLMVAGLASGWGANTPQIVASLGAAVAIVPVTRRIIATGERARLLNTVSWIGAVASLAGVLGVAFHRTPWAAPASGLWRNASALTYANAAGCLFVLTLGASVCALVDRPAGGRRLAAFLTLTGLATTLSRGAAIACVAAVIVLAAVGAAGLLRHLLRPAAGALCAVAFMVPSIGGAARPALALVGLAAGAAIAASPGRSASRWRVAIAVALIVPLGAIAASAAIGRVLERRALPASETRLRTWSNVWNQALDKPLLGYGPGTFSIVENDPRRGPVLTRYVHNEYLQAFFETGALGLATVFGALVAFGAWAWRRRRDDAVWSVACAVCAGFAVHSAFDFLWRFPLLVALAFMWLAVAVTPPPDMGETK